MTDAHDLQSLRTAREAEGYYELELFDDALQRAEALLASGKLEEFARAMKAECLRSLGRFADGAGAFEDILRIRPDDVAAHVGLGWCQKRSGRLDLAIEAMTRLLRARPREAIGLFNLACYSALAGERERALDLLRESIDEDESYRKLAAREEDLATLKDDPRFRRLVAGDDRR